MVDAACGIGTQALGAAARPRRRPAAIGEETVGGAGGEAASPASLDPELDDADLPVPGRGLAGGAFRGGRAILDNALPHLMDPADLALALRQMAVPPGPGRLAAGQPCAIRPAGRRAPG